MHAGWAWRPRRERASLFHPARVLSLLLVCGLGCGIPGLLTVAAEAAGEASLSACSRSLSLHHGTASLNGLPLTAYFTTYDGRDDLPLFDADGVFIRVSSELSLHAAATGEYRTDYLLFARDTLDSTGTASVRFPTADTDRNGVADFLQRSRAGSFSFTGSVFRELPWLVGPMPMTGQITRAAGSTKGTYTASIRDPSAGLVTYRGDVFILNAFGVLKYDRSGNTATVEATVTSENGSSTAYRAASTFTVSDHNTVRFPPMRLTGSDGRLLEAGAFTLIRSGNRYLGSFEFEDGGIHTSWSDYTQWHLELTDTSDRDKDGIPDLSDTFVSPPVIASHPQGRSVVAGESVRLEVTATGPPPMTYQWRRNGQDISRATDSHFTLASAQPADAGDYVVVVRNNSGQITSEVARVTVSPEIPFRLEPPILLPSAEIELVLHTTPGRRYQIQTSEDLHRWVDAAHPFTATAVITVIRHPRGPALGQFLRARWLPGP
jgi:hypothetical protein